jgi:hypothetical protein
MAIGIGLLFVPSAVSAQTEYSGDGREREPDVGRSCLPGSSAATAVARITDNVYAHGGLGVGSGGGGRAGLTFAW